MGGSLGKAWCRQPCEGRGTTPALKSKVPLESKSTGMVSLGTSACRGELSLDLAHV